MNAAPRLTAETFVSADRARVRALALDPRTHARWDLRFTEIGPGAPAADGAERFRYVTRLGLGLAVEGWGETLSESERSQVLRFGSEHPCALIREGAGSWSFREEAGGLRFSTVYDYDVRYGRLGRFVDRWTFRPLMEWATRWSFDRLRLWVERGLAPDVALRLWSVKVAARCALACVWVWEGLGPKLLAADAGVLAGMRPPFVSVEALLRIVGVLQVALGVWLFTGRRERAAVLVTSALMAVFSAVVLALAPEALVDPLGGLAKNTGLAACALAVWLLSPHAPSARRGTPRK